MFRKAALFLLAVFVFMFAQALAAQQAAPEGTPAVVETVVLEAVPPVAVVGEAGSDTPVAPVVITVETPAPVEKDRTVEVVFGIAAAIAIILFGFLADRLYNAVPVPILRVLLSAGEIGLDYAGEYATHTPSPRDDADVAELKRQVAELKARLDVQDTANLRRPS